MRVAKKGDIQSGDLKPLGADPPGLSTGIERCQEIDASVAWS